MRIAITVVSLLAMLVLLGCGGGGSESVEYSEDSESGEHGEGSESGEGGKGSESSEHGEDSNPASTGRDPNPARAAKSLARSMLWGTPMMWPGQAPG